MPALTSISRLSTLVARNATSVTTDTTSKALQVVCAWPLSGQYGPGSRAFYYVLIAVCVYARKAEWLKNALLVPAIASIHGIVLAALHVDDAVDMDVYGAFQLCSIGILTVPITIRLSETAFGRGRSRIFLWFILILVGILSLTVEFFRLKTFDCTLDNLGNPIFPNTGEFPYGAMCGLTCSIDQGPFSLMRSGAVNSIYVIPAPDKITFGTATLLAAACCIPVIISLISMWNTIVEVNWQKRFGLGDDDEVVGGANGAAVARVRGVNALIKAYLGVIEIPVFGAATLVIIVIGEMNFFSSQVHYQNEPMSAIGQWAPIAIATLAVLGVLYTRLTAHPKDEMKEDDHQNQRPSQIREKCSQGRDPDENAVPALCVSTSRAGSFTGTAISKFGVEGGSMRPRAASLPSEFAPPPPTPRGPHAAISLAGRPSFGPLNIPPSPSSGATNGKLGQRGDALERHLQVQSGQISVRHVKF